MSIKTGLFLFLTLCCIITLISGIIDHYCIMEKNFKISGKNKKKLRTIYPKNYEQFQEQQARVQFYWFLYIKECNIISLIKYFFEVNTKTWEQQHKFLTKVLLKIKCLEKCHKLLSSQCSSGLPLKTQKNFGFLMFSRGIKRNFGKKWVKVN